MADSSDATRTAILAASAQETRYRIANPTADPQPLVRVRTNDPLSRDITDSITVAYPSASTIAITFAQPPGAATFLVDITPRHP
jgi:hypothetical protein